MNFIISILEQGLIYGILALGIYITYKIRKDSKYNKVLDIFTR